MRNFLFCLAVTGWIIGLIVHALSLQNIDVAGKFPFVWVLHIGIFVVWLPIVFYLNKNEELKAFRKSGMLTRTDPFGFFKIVLKDTPTWLSIIAITGFVYTIINFMLSMNPQPGIATIKNGQFILQNHGRLIKNLTEKEYLHYKANTLRGFSGHWIAFYGLAMAILFPFGEAGDRTLNQTPAESHLKW